MRSRPTERDAGRIRTPRAAALFGGGRTREEPGRYDQRRDSDAEGRVGRDVHRANVTHARGQTVRRALREEIVVAFQ